MSRFLTSIGAFQEAIDWVGNRTLQEAWEACDAGRAAAAFDAERAAQNEQLEAMLSELLGDTP